LVLLMASKLLDVRFSSALKASLPIYIIFFAAIAFTIFLPEVVLWLPRHVFAESIGCLKSPAGLGDFCP
jgi:C4-dicarboxylate transporter DctM subunit